MASPANPPRKPRRPRARPRVKSSVPVGRNRALWWKSATWEIARAHLSALAPRVPDRHATCTMTGGGRYEDEAARDPAPGRYFYVRENPCFHRIWNRLRRLLSGLSRLRLLLSTPASAGVLCTCSDLPSSRLCLGWRLLFPGRPPVVLASRLLGAAAFSRRALGGSVLRQRPLLYRLLAPLK